MNYRDREKEWREKGALSERRMTSPNGNEIKYYVPKDYDVWSDTLEARTGEDREDVRASLPEVAFDEKTKKWVLHFSDADSGGYDVEPFEYYFDSLNDLIDALSVPSKYYIIEHVKE